MSKKRFTEGLESLFNSSTEASPQEQLVLFPEAKKKKEKPQLAKKESAAKKTTTKNFADDIQSFLTEAFEESFEELTQSTSKQKKTTPRKRRPRQSLGGLDALIRSTVEPSRIEIQNQPTKRISIVFDRSKLEKLKDIARVERTYLKDIIDEIVGTYIQKYEKEEGKSKKSS